MPFNPKTINTNSIQLFPSKIKLKKLSPTPLSASLLFFHFLGFPSLKKKNPIFPRNKQRTKGQSKAKKSIQPPLRSGSRSARPASPPPQRQVRSSREAPARPVADRDDVVPDSVPRHEGRRGDREIQEHHQVNSTAHRHVDQHALANPQGQGADHRDL